MNYIFRGQKVRLKVDKYPETNITRVRLFSLDEAGYWSALCPNGCLATVGEGNSCEDHFKNNFCHCCGQAILWEVPDEE